MRRWAELDRAKGMAIILVVFGHLVARADPAGVGWYGPLRSTLYLFHMPFFFYLSGYVAVLSGAHAAPACANLRRRAARLLPPFLCFGLAILAGKLALSGVVVVDNVPPSLAAGLWALFWDTGHSPATSVWYLIALFAYAAALPLLVRRIGSAFLVVLGLALYVLPVPEVLYLDRIAGYFVFFAAGVAAAQAGTAWLQGIDRWRAGTIALFVTLVIAAIAIPAQTQPAWRLGLGLISMPALHALARAWRAPALAWLGARVLPVYLLNTICIGLAKAALLPLLGWRAESFPLFAAVLMIAGLFGPVLLVATLTRAAPTVERQFLR